MRRKLISVAALVCCLVAATCAAPRPAAAQTRRPNIVFVITDDQRWDSLGATGHPFAKTPNIDRLAREGVLFRNFFTTTSLCSPSRASFLTGQYARRHRVVNSAKNSNGWCGRRGESNFEPDPAAMLRRLFGRLTTVERR